MTSSAVAMAVPECVLWVLMSNLVCDNEGAEQDTRTMVQPPLAATL